MGRPIWVPDPTNGKALVDAWEHATRGNTMSMWRERQEQSVGRSETATARHQREWSEGLENMRPLSSCAGCGAVGDGKCEYCGRPR